MRADQPREENQITQTQCQTRSGGPVAQGVSCRRFASQLRSGADGSGALNSAARSGSDGSAKSRRGDSRHPGCSTRKRPHSQSLPMSAVRLPDSRAGTGGKTTRLAQQSQQPRRLLARSKAALQQAGKSSVRRSAAQQHLPRVTWGIPKATIKQTEMNRVIEVSKGEWGCTQ